jgi:hypothetical protein
MTETLTDTRIAFGVRCTWWDSIGRVGHVGPPGMRLPCCPTCGGMLYEVKDEATWMAGVDKHEARHPGYRAMVLWARGRCFPNHEAVKRAFEKAHGGGPLQ